MTNKIVVNRKISVGGGLHARIKSNELLKEVAPQLDPKMQPNRLVLICDFSSSMESYANPNDRSSQPKSKLNLLAEGVQDFALRSDTSTTALAVESFPAGFRIELTSDNQSVWMRMLQIRSLGDTPMGQGLRNALEYHTPTRAVLISDGEQTDGDACFSAAEQYRSSGVICDCFHIGDSTRGEETLKRIAEITGGMYFKFRDVGAFSASLHHLLPGQREVLAQLPESTRGSLMKADEVR